MARVHRVGMAAQAAMAGVAMEPMGVVWTDARTDVYQAGVTAAVLVAMRCRAMHSRWTTRHATSARAHRKIAAAPAVVMVAAITAARLPIWAAVLTVASRRVQLKAGSPIRCAPALT